MLGKLHWRYKPHIYRSDGEWCCGQVRKHCVTEAGVYPFRAATGYCLRRNRHDMTVGEALGIVRSRLFPDKERIEPIAPDRVSEAWSLIRTTMEASTA